MKYLVLKLLSFVSAVMAPGMTSSAYAHWGHVGDLAGHGHWIALGAAAAAAALAAWLHNREDEQSDAVSDADDANEEISEGEPA